MRYPIWKKDDFFEIAGWRMDMDATVVEFSDELLLTWMYNWDGDPVGKVIDVRLEDGEITGEVEFFDPKWDDSKMDILKCRLGGYYTGVEKTVGKERITKCRLRAVSVMLLDQTPGFPIRGESMP